MAAAAASARKSVFVVEDDPAARRALARLLEDEGYHVRAAGDGRQALERLRADPPPDLILLDLALPVLDGWQFREQQRRDPALAAVPVVLVSGRGDLPREAEALAAAGCLDKPLDEGRLLAEVRRLAGWPGAGVLVVDDEPAVRQVLGLALRHFGFTVLLASGGREAVELYRRRGDGIDVVLLDVRMPGLDGPRTLAALRELDPRVRCCFMSGDAGESDTAALLALGAAHVFAKPFASLEGLARTLRRAAVIGGDG